ncbi:hypothetical protein BC939DRAFT_472308 [Gamsiella multidivaricata]|uniref:uncharacterized protein n=1 Tax=Gamsiella multidivaricata TaxID=101098 RepID=UPI00221E6606|nr:uncharacterized protein BC939DRAFT_472308 [Gamsiella multidivaricata]KAG0357213.1 hypothetical protein BGZ54_000408 [Gamsiella multidivaricata]KAI7832721.1 hypothetical protein BC939DRAFT_472308 [Gamsiella multidivaricata]
MNTLMDIPELLSTICHNLDRHSLLAATLVSRSWNYICSPLLWEYCLFSAEQYGLFHDIFDNHAQLIRHMDAKHRLIGNEMRFVAQQCTNLASLKLQNCHVAPSSLEILCEGIPQVQFLAFELCRGVNSSSIASRLTRLPRLSRLDIVVHVQERGNGDWRENDVALMLTGCSLLEYLRIVGPDLSHIHLRSVRRHSSPLRLVQLHLVSTFISEGALENLLAKSPNLSTLILLMNANKNSMVQAIANNCPNLRMLELKNSKSIATSAFGSVFKKCPLLTNLDISYTLIYDAAISALAQHCSRLRILDLTGCSRMTHVAFLELMSRLTNLKELLVSGCTRLRIAAFSDATVWASRGSLEVLDISSVGIKVGSDSLEGLVQHLRSLKRLRQLYLDEAVSQHGDVQRLLESLDVVLSITEPAHQPPN